MVKALASPEHRVFCFYSGIAEEVGTLRIRKHFFLSFLGFFFLRGIRLCAECMGMIVLEHASDFAAIKLYSVRQIFLEKKDRSD